MNTFYIDLGQLNETIEGYEALLTSLETCNSSLDAATDTIDEEAYSGDDAEVLRNNWNNQFSVTLPYSINTIKEVQAAFCDAREEFAACRKFSMDMQNIFGVSSYAPSAEEGGILKCDYDALSQSVNYSNELTTECMDVKNKLTRVNSSLDSIHESCAEIYDCLDVVKADISQLDVIEPHKFDLISYAEKVAAADSHLDTKFKGVLIDASDSGLLSPDMSVGTLTLDPYTDIDWTIDVDDIEAQIQALEAKKKEYEELMFEHQTSYTLVEFYNDQIVEINNEIRELNAAFNDEVVEKLAQFERSESFLYTYNYLCTLDYSVGQRADIVSYWKSIDGLDDYEIRGKEMPEWWMDSHSTIPEELAVTEENVLNYDKEEQLKNHYLQNSYICDCISGMGNQTYNGNYLDANTIISGNVSGDICYERWYDYMYGDMADYVRGNNSVRAIKYAISQNIDSDVLHTNIGIYSVNDNYESMVYDYAINLYTDGVIKYDIDNNQAYLWNDSIMYAVNNSSTLTEEQLFERKADIEMVYEKIKDSNYIILWSYSGAKDIIPYEKHYLGEYDCVVIDKDDKGYSVGITDEWSDDLMRRFYEESAYARAAYTRRDELIYYEGVPEEQIIVNRVTGANSDMADHDNIYNYWNSELANVKNVGTVDIFSHGYNAKPEPYDGGTYVYDWYDDGENEPLSNLNWTDNMDIGARLRFHGCHTIELDSLFRGDKWGDSHDIANYFGVTLQGNEYFGSFSKNKTYFESIEDFVPYDRNNPVYLYTYKNVDFGMKNTINTTTIYPEGE